MQEYFANFIKTATRRGGMAGVERERFQR